MKSSKLERTNIDGEYFLTVRQFAGLTHRSKQSIHKLMKNGNRIRKLKCKRYNGHPYIPFEELTDFPFTMPGRSIGVQVYKYRLDDKGAYVPYLFSS